MNADRSIAIVLCGGASRRMGRPKWALPWPGGPTLLESVMRELAAVVDELVLVGLPADAAAHMARAHGAVYLADPPSRIGQGPLAGFTTGLDHARARACSRGFLCACDLPLLRRGDVAALETVFLDARTLALVPEVQSRGHSIISPFGSWFAVAEMARHCEQLWARGERRLTRAFLEPEFLRLPHSGLPNADMLRGCNTPEQYADLRALESNRSR